MAIDQKTMEAVAQQIYPELYRYCFARIVNKQNVEDVVQNVFLVLQEKSGELTPDNLRSWLFNVAQKKLLEERREDIRRSRFVSYDVEVIAKDPMLVYEIVEEQITDGEVDAMKERILRTLTPEERSLFEAIYEKRLKRKEAAKQFNITENALNVRVHRLKKRIESMTYALTMIIILIIVKCK